MMPNLPEFTIAYFGILYAGCTVVPLNVLLSAPEVTYHLQDSRGGAADRAPALRASRRARARRRAGVPVVWSDGGARRRRCAAMAAAAPLRALHPTAADRHRGDPLHVGHHGQAEGRRAHALEPVRQLRRGRAEARCRSRRDSTSRSPRCRSSTPSGRPAIQNATIARGGTLHAAAALQPGRGASRSWSATASRSSRACPPCTSRCSTTRAPRATTSRACAGACRAARRCRSR